MVKKRTSTTEVLESFLLGLSCVVGGDNFSFLLSHTTVSVRIQSILFLCVAIIATFASVIVDTNYGTIVVFHSIHTSLVIISIIYLRDNAAVFLSVLAVGLAVSAIIKSMNDVFLNLIHWYYTVLSATICIFVFYRTRGRTFTTLLTISLGYILPFLIINSCSYYCTSRTALLCFLFGLFSSRFLPSFFWYLINEKSKSGHKVQFVSEALVISRLLSCLLSICIKLSTGRFNLSINIMETASFELPSIELISGFTELSKHVKSVVYIPKLDERVEFNHSYLDIVFSILPVTSFISSVMVYLTFPPINLLGTKYSQNFVSNLSKIKMVSHLVGSVLGIAYPASVTGNSYVFYPIIFFIYVVPVILWVFIYNRVRDVSRGTLYFICMASGVGIGYTWTYCLGIIVNTFLNKTCKYEEVQNSFWYDLWGSKVKKLRPCCGNKITDHCYCKLPSIIRGLKETEDELIFRCSKLTCNGKQYKNLKYSTKGKIGVLICAPGIGNGLNNCGNPCSSCNNGCCVKIVRVYNLETVTKSSCQNCQLVIRMEGSCSSNNEKCKACCPGGTCVCNKNGQNCCCICLKCCNGSCGTDQCCCCIKYCNSRCQSCGCTGVDGLETRVFIAYPNGSGKCCIKEIKPNYVDNFDGDINNHGEFDIRDIFISDCCHSDLRVDLHCGMKNNMFRLTGMNYPKKSDSSLSLELKYVISKCCKKAGVKCCCTYRELVRACIKYDDSECSDDPEKGCSGSQNLNCTKYCTLTVDQEDSFTKRVNKIRIKLIVICWMIIAIVYFIAIMILMIIKSCNESYNFDGKISYSKIKEPVKKQPFNSVNQLNTRLTPFVGAGNMDNLIESKNNEVDKMMEIFKRSMSDKDFPKLSKYIDKKSHSFISSSNKPEIKKLEFTLVVWGHCIGLLYNYVHFLFHRIQRFFFDWEELWEIESCLHLKNIKKVFDMSSWGSRRFIVHFNDPMINEEHFNKFGIKRFITWNGVLSELKNSSNMIDNDPNVKDCLLAVGLESGLYCYLDLWKNRIDIVNKIVERRMDLYDWVRFLTEYSKIKEFADEITPYLKLAGVM